MKLELPGAIAFCGLCATIGLLVHAGRLPPETLMALVALLVPSPLARPAKPAEPASPDMPPPPWERR
ncbi:MAG TPA: hypothetical protein VEA38_24825 [Terriglobales bacterium]|nr:hypothetical protein [Terriglobales bacterium]